MDVRRAEELGIELGAHRIGLVVPAVVAGDARFGHAECGNAREIERFLDIAGAQLAVHVHPVGKDIEPERAAGLLAYDLRHAIGGVGGKFFGILGNHDLHRANLPSR